jgi:hypothetical protein
VYLTRGGSVQRSLTNGPRGWSVGPTMQPLVGWFRADTLQEVVKGNPKLKVDGGQTPWPVVHVGGPIGHHSLEPYKYSPTGGNQKNTLYL